MRRVIAVVLLALAALAVPTRAQDVRGQERPITRGELDEKAEPGRTIEEVRAALGRPLFAQCSGRIQIWGYRTDTGRIDLMFVDGVLRMTIIGGVGMSGTEDAC